MIEFLSFWWPLIAMLAIIVVLIAMMHSAWLKAPVSPVAVDQGQLARRVIAGEGNAVDQASLVVMQYQVQLSKDEKGKEAA